jgi:hypothetical protein
MNLLNIQAVPVVTAESLNFNKDFLNFNAFKQLLRRYDIFRLSKTHNGKYQGHRL